VPVTGGAPDQPWMARWARGSMVVRLWGGLVLFALLLLAAAGLIHNGVSHQDKSVDGLIEHLHPLQIANLEVRSGFAQSQSALHAYLLTGEARYLDLYRQDRSALIRDLRQTRPSAADGEAAAIAAQSRAALTWLGYAAQMESLHPGSPALIRLTGQSSASAQNFYQASDRLQARLQAASRAAVLSGGQSVDHAVTVASVFATVAAMLGLVAALAIIHGITGPLRGLVAILRRLTAGDHTARAAVTGPAEMREVARSLNALADESDRLRTQEAETARLRAIARDTGLRVREHLRVEDLLGEAKDAIERSFGADVAYLHIKRDGGLSLPVGHEHDWLFPDSFLAVLRTEGDELFQDLFRRNASLVYQDIPGTDGDRMAPNVRDPLRAAGVVAEVIVPFGSGSEMLGIIVAARMHHGRPWTGAEVSAVELVAADVGRGLHHARLYEAENRLVDELRAVDQVKSDFLATVSHELRTPLTSISGYVEILRDRAAGPLTPAQDRMLDSVDRNAARLRHLIEDVLTLSKIESGAFTSMMRPVSLTEIVAADVGALQPAAAAKGLTLDWQDSDHGLMISGDPGQLDRLVMNLLSNAVKFTPGGGTVSVDTGCDGDLAVLRVSDTGIGIPETERKELFTRFFRASNAVEESIPGTGLGLAIAHTIVANHHGDLDLVSAAGQGTTVTVRIPLLTDQGAWQPLPDVPVHGEGRPA
jgi:two-component system, OmpR family, phosphate regulon sensor histidine kinase PhoR